MKLIGVDIDGTLLPLKGKSDDLEGIRQAVFAAIRAGHCLMLVTSRSEPEEGRQRLLDEHGIDLPVFGFSRDDPAGKGRWLLECNARTKLAETVELWDDEDYFLLPAVAQGIKALKVFRGQLLEFVQRR